ncbi:MAG: SDR family oxidoreductase [Anaerolineae bacterium]|nr:SDR family oxidoreductase [Anaerolineae bacterium]
MSKTVFITGCSSGIGRATVKRFAENGWNVVATMRHPEAETELNQLAEVVVLPLDVTDQAGIASAVEAGLARFGRIDALINNAGYGQFGLFEALAPEKIQEQFAVNVFGVMDIIRALLPHFRANQAGIIVNVSSGAGIFTLPMTSLYCASKFALEGFSEALAYELASQNILVKLIEPHGGVSSTNFGTRSVSDMALDPSLTDYNAFVSRTNATFAAMVAGRMVSADDVGQIIWEAVTDGTDQLRYLIGDDARGFVKARRELSDQDYIAFMRSYF